MRVSPALRVLKLLCIVLSCACACARTQVVPDAPLPQPQTQNQTTAPLRTRTQQDIEKQESREQKRAAEALRVSQLAIINGRPYDQPSTRDTLIDYAKDTYLWPAQIRTTIRAVYAEARGKPVGWGENFPGFMQRFGSAEAITAINGNVRLAMELTFHEDLRYIPCHGCSIKAKIENSLLAEVTARHDTNGHRFFTLTPTIADFSGPIIAHSYWYPKGFDPVGGVVSTRLVFATRIGQHLFQEFVLERRHKDPKIEY